LSSGAPRSGVASYSIVEVWRTVGDKKSKCKQKWEGRFLPQINADERGFGMRDDLKFRPFRFSYPNQKRKECWIQEMFVNGEAVLDGFICGHYLSNACGFRLFLIAIPKSVSPSINFITA
jgi:hypothetical protein